MSRFILKSQINKTCFWQVPQGELLMIDFDQHMWHVSGDSWMTGQQVKLMMDKDFPESPLSAEVVLDSPQFQNLDRQIWNHEYQNSNSQNPNLDQTECSNLDQNRSQVPRGEKDSDLTSGQDADCPDPPGAQNQNLQRDLDHGEDNWFLMFIHSNLWPPNTDGVWRPHICHGSSCWRIRFAETLIGKVWVHVRRQMEWKFQS